MQQEFDLPILGVVKPGAKVAVETTANKRIGLIGTEANIRSGVYTRYIKSLDDEAKVFEKHVRYLFRLLRKAGFMMI